MVAESISIVSDATDEELLTRPFPTGIRDLGDRHYEAADEWSRERIGGNGVIGSLSSDDSEDQAAALRQQDVTLAERTLADELGQAEETIKRLLGCKAPLVDVCIRRSAGRTVIQYVVTGCVGNDERVVRGEGATIWEAVDDMRACAASAKELPAAAAVA